MTCPACEESAREVSHLFHAGCQGCKARAAARGPHFRRCRDAGRLDRQYRELLQSFGLTHDEVRAAHAADFLERATT